MTRLSWELRFWWSQCKGYRELKQSISTLWAFTVVKVKSRCLNDDVVFGHLFLSRCAAVMALSCFTSHAGHKVDPPLVQLPICCSGFLVSRNISGDSFSLKTSWRLSHRLLICSICSQDKHKSTFDWQLSPSCQASQRLSGTVKSWSLGC